MAEFPVPLDNLITYVKALHPDGGPLDNVSGAIWSLPSSMNNPTR